jgi:hypothetical protein
MSFYLGVLGLGERTAEISFPNFLSHAAAAAVASGRNVPQRASERVGEGRATFVVELKTEKERQRRKWKSRRRRTVQKSNFAGASVLAPFPCLASSAVV